MSQVSDARQAARSIIRKLGITAPPVDLAAVLQELDIGLIEQDLDDELSGMALISEGDRYVIVNRKHHPNRKRFTIAHECGHHVLHWKELQRGVHVDKGILMRDALSAVGRDLMEISANAFAAELLMPKSLVAMHVPRDLDIQSDEHKIERLAKLFGVSTAAFSIRLINLN